MKKSEVEIRARATCEETVAQAADAFNLAKAQAWATYERVKQAERIRTYELAGEPNGCYHCGNPQHRTSDCVPLLKRCHMKKPEVEIGFFQVQVGQVWRDIYRTHRKVEVIGIDSRHDKSPSRIWVRRIGDYRVRGQPPRTYPRMRHDIGMFRRRFRQVRAKPERKTTE